MAKTERIEEMVKALLESWRVTNPNAPMWQHPEDWYDTIEVMARAALSFLGFDPDNPPAEGAVKTAVEALWAYSVHSFKLGMDRCVDTALAALAPCAVCGGSGQVIIIKEVTGTGYGPPGPDGEPTPIPIPVQEQNLELCDACQGTGALAALEGRDG